MLKLSYRIIRIAMPFISITNNNFNVQSFIDNRKQVIEKLKEMGFKSSYNLWETIGYDMNNKPIISIAGFLNVSVVRLNCNNQRAFFDYCNAMYNMKEKLIKYSNFN